MTSRSKPSRRTTGRKSARTTNKLPKELTKSELYYDSPKEAQRLWDEGYREIKVQDLKRGMAVAYYTTDVFRMEVDRSIPVKFAIVHQVEYDENCGTVKVFHGGGVAEEDENTPVWAGWMGEPILDFDSSDEMGGLG